MSNEDPPVIVEPDVFFQTLLLYQTKSFALYEVAGLQSSGFPEWTKVNTPV